MIDDDCIKTLIHKYFQQKNILENHQIESYDDFIDNIFPSILSQFFPIVIVFNDKEKNIQRIELEISKMSIEKPYYTENNGCSKNMTPMIARLRNHTYSLTILVTLKVNIYNYQDDNEILAEEKIINDVIFGKIPLIVKSKYCNIISLSECCYDTGGYFIVNGNEKVLITQERLIPNQIQIYENTKISSKYKFVAEIRSLDGDSFSIPKSVSIKYSCKKNIYENQLFISIPHLKQDVPLCVVFKACGCLTDKEIIYSIIDNNDSEIDIEMIRLLKSSIMACSEIRTEREAINYLAKYLNNCNSSFTNEMKYKYCKSILKNEYLCHLQKRNTNKD